MTSQHDVVQQDAHAAAHGDDDSMFWLPWLHDRTVQPVYGCTTALCSWPTAMRSWSNHQSSLLCICMHASAGQANNVTALALESDGLQPTLVENKPCIQHPVLAGPHGTGPGPPHIGYEQGIKDKIIAHVETVLTGAPSVLAAAAFDAAVAAHNAANAAAAVLVPPGAAVAVPPMSAPSGVAGQLPIDWLAQLYRWIDTTLGQARANGLLHASQNSQFENFKITDVGIHRDTISCSYEALVRLNKQRNVPFGPMEMWIKFLGQITFPKMLANKALEQLQNPTFIISVGPNAGQPDLASLVTSFEELWHMIYDKGVEIKPQAAPRAPTERSNRVDGMGNWIIPEEFAAPDGTSLMPSYQSDNFVWSGITDAELHEACLVSAGSEAFAFVKNERNCWVCKGLRPHQGEVPIRPQRQEVAGCVHQWTAGPQGVARRSHQRPPISSNCSQARSLAHEEQGDDE